MLMLVPMLQRRDAACDAPASVTKGGVYSASPRWSVVLPVPTLEHRDEWEGLVGKTTR